VRDPKLIAGLVGEVKVAARDTARYEPSASRWMLLTEPEKYEAPCTPDDETRFSVASIVSRTSAFQLRPAFSVV